MNTSELGPVWKRKTGGMTNTTTLLIPSETAVKDKNKNKNKSKKKREKAERSYGLVSFQELPEYMKDNEFILNYYRAEWPLKETLFSIFRWHNETLNVWTHLIGFILFLGLTFANLMHVPQLADFITIFTRHFPTSTEANFSHNSKEFLLRPTKLIDLKQELPFPMDITPPEVAATQWPFFIFLGGSMFCLLSSSICHLFSCHSHHLNLLLLQMDYVGIAVMIITSFFPPIFYIFQCDPHWQFIYLGGITVMGICTIITLLSPGLSTGKFRSFRALLFVSMGLFGLVPAIHALVVNWGEPQRNVTLAYESAMAVSYLVGAMFYVGRIPERWKPGWFDLAGHSHQIFHVFVIMGALAHYGAALVFLEYRGRIGCDRNI
ncbi:unnamed protein product [Ilex paraguariensis]|uniref:Heptahelical transmembrane protein 1-like n=1 Tax=Ilex paraguariensis TaxID=185542 RepID=A0ABC8R6M3_9AQUA